MPNAKVAHGGTRKSAGRKTKHVDGTVQLGTRIARITANRLDALRRESPKESRAETLERLIEAEYRRVFGGPAKMVNGFYVGTGG
jgi:hypothetical protein